MLIQVIQTYSAKPGLIEDLQLAVLDIRNRLMGSYLGRHGHATYADPARQQVALMGMLLHRTAVEDMQTTDEPNVAKVRSRLSDLITTPPVTEFREVAFSQDDKYCEHARREDLVIVCDPILGQSPVQCNQCGGHVAPYRLGLREDTATQLLCWDWQYGDVYHLWLHSSDYETWASRELTSPQSVLNRLGMDVAGRMADDLQCQVSYHLHTGE